MPKGNRIDNDVLLQAGLKLMLQNGKPLTKLPSKGRSMLFELPDGDTVRARTCNDHILIAVADSPSPDAKLNIDGTDWLLIVMPEEERTHGKVLAYLVPTTEAVAEARRTHEEWLANNPNTKGANTTWNLWFDDDGSGKANNYARKWAKYLLEGDVLTLDSAIDETHSQDRGGNIKAEVEAARERIASVAGVSPQAVKISIDFAA